MKIGILTGGGDAPGLNGIIEASARVLLENGCEVVGIRDGFEGIFKGRVMPLNREAILNAHSQAGTLLGTSNRSSTAGREAEFVASYKKLGLEGLIVCGGDGTFAALAPLAGDVKIIGVPKTIDNDLRGTDITFGYDTACAVVSESVDALRFTADAHSRVFVIEAMGRTAGWIALGGGLASYADAILIPERPFSRPDLKQYILRRQAEGRRGLTLVVSEGAFAQAESASVAFAVDAPQAERYGGMSFSLSRWIEKETGWESRHVVLGHLQRSRHPTTTDRFLTLAMGLEAARMAMEKSWGHAVVYRQGLVQRAPLADFMGGPRLVTPDHRWVKMAQALGTYI